MTEKKKTKKNPTKKAVSPPKKVASKEQPSEQDFVDATFDQGEAEAALKKFEARARKIAPEMVVVARVDTALVAYNVQVGVANVQKALPTLQATLRSVEDAMINDLPLLALAVRWAERLAQHDEAPQGVELRKEFARARALRSTLLLAAESLAAVGKLPYKRVESIRSGRGFIDMATDCVELAAIFTEHDELRKMTPVGRAMVSEAAKMGASLLTKIRPSRAKRADKRSESQRDAIELRDRLFTLLTQQHEQLWRYGALLFGRDVDSLVPNLQARAAAPSKKSEAKESQ